MSRPLPSGTPSPPKSRSSSKRRPLHLRTDSDINEAPRHALGSAGSQEQENLDSIHNSRSGVGDKVYSTLPFPLLESQIFRPPRADREPSSISISNPTFITQSLNQQDAQHSTTAIETPTRQHSVFLNEDSPYSFDSQVQPFSVQPAALHFSPTLSIQTGHLNPDTVIPASTIRLVTDDGSFASSESGRFGGHSERSPSLNSSPALGVETSGISSSGAWQWPRSALTTTGTGPDTPTPASRTIRSLQRNTTVANSAGAQYATPESVRSANSIGTLIHHERPNDRDDLPVGSYLHYADRHRRSFSNPSILSSSPIVQVHQSSSPLADSPESVSSRASQFSFRRNSSGFPALRRYLEVAEAAGQQSGQGSEPSSPVSECAPDPRLGWQPVRSHAQRWTSMMSLSTIPSVPEGTTAPSSIRVVSTEPSNLFDDTETSQLTADTVQSSIRMVRRESMCQAVEDLDASTMSQDTMPQPSIRLVSPATSYSHDDADTSALTFATQSSIRVVEHSPEVSEEVDRHWRSSTDETPPASRTPRRDQSTGAGSYGSPAWISYSSPVQLPHIRNEQDSEESDGYSVSTSRPESLESSPSILQLPLPSGAPLSDGSAAAGMPYRRRSVWEPSQTSPFFHGSSSRNRSRRPSNGHISTQPEATEEHQPHILQTRTVASGPLWSQSDPSSEAEPWPIASPSITDLDTGLAASSSHDVPHRPRQMAFPAASSSVNNTPASIHVPRNRPHDRSIRIQHIRARTLGSTNANVAQRPSSVSSKSPRRSSSPVMPYNYPTPITPSDRPARPSNPTPGVTPGVTPARDRRVRHTYQPTLPEIDLVTGSEPISYPSVVHRSSHYQLSGRVGHRDFSPHLWHSATQTVNRRSIFRPPSVDEFQVHFMAGAKARRDLQIACFALGFLLPICWIAASFVPLPGRGNVESITTVGGRKRKAKFAIGDLEKVEGYDAFTAEEVAGYESARWWRGMNRCLGVFGVGVMVVLLVLGVLTSRGGLQA